MADLNALLVFAGVVEAGSFSAASRRLGMLVSTVSRQIAALEDQLGLRLIERSTRRFRVTETGGRLLEQARRGLEVSDAVDRLAAEQAVSVTGLLRVSTSPGIAEALLVPVITAFAADHPDVRVRLSVSDRPEDDLAEPGRLGDPDWRIGRQLADRSQAPALARPAAGQSGVSRRGGATSATNGPAQASPACSGGWDVRRALDLSPARGRRSGNRAHPSAPRHGRSGKPSSGGVGRWRRLRAALNGPARSHPGRAARAGDAGLDAGAVDLFLVHLGRRHMPRPVQLFKEMAARMIPGLCPGPPP